MARSFNGTTDQILSSSFAGPSAGTLSGWFNTTGSGLHGYNGIVGQQLSGTQFFSIYLRNTLKMAWYVTCGGGTVSIDPGTASVTASVWYHAALTYDSTNGLKTYFNGASDGTAAANGTINAVTAGFAIGFDNNTAGRNFPGSIADAAMWNVALSAGNITSLYNGVRPINVNSANLIGWWPLDGYASPEPDLSGSGNNGTLTGTTGIIGPSQLWRISA